MITQNQSVPTETAEQTVKQNRVTRIVAERKRGPIPKQAEPLGGVDARLVSLIARGTVEAEQYRGLRHAVEQMHKPGEGTLVGVCSPIPGDGKSTTAINLAGALAQDLQARVLLIEADLHRPFSSITDRLAMAETDAGLVEAIQDPSITLEQVIRRLPRFNLSVLPGGRRPSAPYEIFKSPRFAELLAQVRRRYDYVILDTSPVVSVLDCRLIEKHIDGFFMVVAADKTPQAVLEEALSLMRPESILGLVFNGHDLSDLRRHGYCAYGYAADQPRKRIRLRWWARSKK